MTKVNEPVVVEEVSKQLREDYIAEMSEEWSEVGSTLMHEREARGFSIAEVARNVGVSPSTLRRFEKGNPVQAARIIEQGYRMYLELKKHADEVEASACIDSHENGYGMCLRDGSVVVYCVNSGLEFFSIHEEGYDNMKEAVQHAVKVATALGYTPFDTTHQINAILSTPDLKSANEIHYFVYGDGVESIRAWKGGGCLSFDSTNELLMYAAKELEFNQSVYTDVAIVEPLDDGTFKVTTWSNGDTLRTNSMDRALKQIGFSYAGSVQDQINELIESA